jgi:hypothetical protein
MKPAILVFILITAISSSPTAQVSTHIGNYVSDAKYTRNFVGEFDFETLPEPLKPSRVNFTLEVAETRVPAPPLDWEIKVRYEPKYMRLISDSVFFWPAPRSIGDRMSGSLEFIPLVSGYWEFTLELVGPLYRGSTLPVGLCFDPDGNLTYLGNRKRNQVDCDYPRTTFFNTDSVHIIQYAQSLQNPDLIFNYSMTIAPPFRAGDTSRITYHLMTVRNMPNPVCLIVESDGFVLTTLPEPLNGPYLVGQELELYFEVVPQAVPSAIRLTVDFEEQTPNNGRDVMRQHTVCRAVLSDDGSLRLVGDESLDNVSYYYSQWFPAATSLQAHKEFRRITIEPTAKSKD